MYIYQILLWHEIWQIPKTILVPVGNFLQVHIKYVKMSSQRIHFIILKVMALQGHLCYQAQWYIHCISDLQWVIVCSLKR